MFFNCTSNKRAQDSNPNYTTLLPVRRSAWMLLLGLVLHIGKFQVTLKIKNNNNDFSQIHIIIVTVPSDCEDNETPLAPNCKFYIPTDYKEHIFF